MMSRRHKASALGWHVLWWVRQSNYVFSVSHVVTSVRRRRKALEGDSNVIGGLRVETVAAVPCSGTRSCPLWLYSITQGTVWSHKMRE